MNSIKSFSSGAPTPVSTRESALRGRGCYRGIASRGRGGLRGASRGEGNSVVYAAPDNKSTEQLRELVTRLDMAF